MAASKKAPTKPVRRKPTAGKNQKKTSGAKARSAAKKTSSPLSGEITSIIFAAAGVFVFFCIYFESFTGFLGAPVKGFLLGLFGMGAYILPPITIVLAIYSLINRDFKLISKKLAQGVALFMNFQVFMHLLSFEGFSDYTSVADYAGAYYGGGAINNGGLIGAAFGNIFLSIFGKFGAYLIVVILFMSLGMLLTGKSLFSVILDLYVGIRDRLAEAEDLDEFEEETVIERRPAAKARRREREQAFIMPPVRSRGAMQQLHRDVVRSKPTNIIIENNSKQSDGEGVMIFNKSQKTVKKPIMMPPTRGGIVNTLTLNRPEAKANEGHEEGHEIDEQNDMNDMFSETPLIRHYERRSFSESVPFSGGGRYKYPEDHPFGLGAVDEVPEDDDEGTDREWTSAGFVDEPITDAVYNDSEEDENSEEDETTHDSDNDDDWEQSADLEPTVDLEQSGAFEQKLYEQEMNALKLASPVDSTLRGGKAGTGSIGTASPIQAGQGTWSALPQKQAVKNVPMSTTETRYENYVFPSAGLLNRPPQTASSVSRAQILETSRKLEETLKSFGVEAKVIEVAKGPTVTRYELSPGAGVKVRKISDLGNDLALNLAAESIRIEAPIPGKAAVGIEIPNKEVTPVFLREVIDDDLFRNYHSRLAFALGKDITGNTVVTDIAKMPHLLIAGATGSGKSVCINTLITSLIYKSDPNDVKLVMIDPKVVELSIYNGIPHLLIPVVTDPKKAAGALNWAVQEMLARYNAFAETSVRDLKGYNELIRERGESGVLPQIVIIIDELADLMMAAPGEVEDAICRLAQMARAAGLHLIIATQRPSVDVITGVIKANIPSRLAFSVSSGTDSRTILDMVGAEKLLGKGDMLFCPMGASKPIRVQGAYITDREVEGIVNFLKAGRGHNYDEDVIARISATKGIGEASDDLDEFFEDAIEFLIQKEKASASMLQRQFRIGYNRASRLIEELENRGIVGAEDGSKPRKVLMTRVQWEEYKQSKA